MAFGLCCMDGNMIRLRRANENSKRYGAEVASVTPFWLNLIAERGGVPVLAPVGVGTDNSWKLLDPYQLAARCAIAWNADALIFLTEEGVRDCQGNVMRWLEVANIHQISTVEDNMAARLKACREALEAGVHRARIFPSSHIDSLADFYFTRIEYGTEIVTHSNGLLHKGDISMSNLSFTPIERVTCLSYDRFYQDYDLPQRPVVITGVASNWRAAKEWNHEWFKKYHGNTPVNLSLEKTHTTTAARMKLSEYIDLIATGKEGGLYMDQFSFERIPGLASYLETPYANPKRRNIVLNLWIGPAGTFISLHKDNHNSLDYANNIFAQIYGRKRVVLVSPDQDNLMYARSKEQGAHWHSQVDWENPDFDKFPLFRNVKLQETILNPGDILFIPGNYWHSLRSLDPSISVSCWWRVHRIVDVVVSSLRNTLDPSDRIKLADIEEFGGVRSMSTALESENVSVEMRATVWSLLSPEARSALENCGEAAFAH